MCRINFLYSLSFSLLVKPKFCNNKREKKTGFTSDILYYKASCIYVSHYFEPASRKFNRKFICSVLLPSAVLHFAAPAHLPGGVGILMGNTRQTAIYSLLVSSFYCFFRTHYKHMFKIRFYKGNKWIQFANVHSFIGYVKMDLFPFVEKSEMLVSVIN